ncbi:tetratricopeptide repeat protein [Bizionia arctica]|uniref:Tetratricopeptide repeat protein n=1 Tax=Bizionia arctica TaxID=1495645 RepID=A0A917GBX7_9FLAO|nr:tetratricopeptide repeat protein [Bizionia arctica]GGG37295.1 hypothetical protein GCM10010976_06240 [Bizionia arctica]
MKKIILLTIFTCIYSLGISQDIEESSKETLLKELAESGCNCIDSIQIYNKPKTDIALEIHKCIDDVTGSYQLGSKLMDIEELKEDVEVIDGKKEINISLNVNEDSEEYKQFYYELERYMMDLCASLKEKMSTDEKQNAKSISENDIAGAFYDRGITAAKNGFYEEAVKNFQKAVNEDPEFSFAWDNLGVNYRRLNKFDEAIDAYEKSLKIDPNGLMPLQNIAVAYQYKKEYKKAIKAYKKLSQIDKNNPEVFYGFGTVYAINLQDYEKGLENMCIAYNLYIEQKSPYRADAEKIINYIFSEMKKLGQEDKFNQILKDNNISQN